MNIRRYFHWCIRFLAVNTLISCLIAILLFNTPSSALENVYAALFAIPYFIGHFGLLLILLLSPAFLIGMFLPFRLSLSLMAIYSAFLQALLLIDTFVYQQYRFHINLFVLDLLVNTKGQVISFPWFLWAIVALVLIAFVVFQFFMGSRLKPLASKVRYTKRILAIWFLCLLGSHLIHIFADAMFYRPITGVAQVPPFPIPAVAGEELARLNLIDVEKHKSKSLESQNFGGKLAYPHAPMTCQTPPEQPKNVLIIMVDSLRYDHLSAEVMPNTYEFGKNAVVFNKHFSGSNSTRGGVFSFFYGLPPLYFESFRQSHTPPVLMNLFQDSGYEYGIFSSAPLTKPEFDQTVFSGIKDLRVESKEKRPHTRDQEITSEWLKFTASRDGNKPFFGFLFYDAVHGFDHVPGQTPFEPYLKTINYFTLNNGTDPTEFLNRYKNSVHFVDSQIAEVLKDLKERELLEDTIVVFTSDHGKEFNDNKLNYWGHNSNFTDSQTQVPFYIYWPGRAPQTLEKWTSHYDFPATLAEELFNCSTSPEKYSAGRNLFQHEGHNWILLGTYGDMGIRLSDHIITMKHTGAYETLDLNYRPMEMDNPPLDIYKAAISEMKRFYK